MVLWLTQLDSLLVGIVRHSFPNDRVTVLPVGYHAWSVSEAGTLVFGLKFAHRLGRDGIAKIRIAAPGLALLAAVDGGLDSIADAFDLGRLGADALWCIATPGRDSGRELRRAVESAILEATRRQVWGSLGTDKPMLVRDALELALRPSDKIESPARLAQDLGVTSSRLRTLFRGSGLPSPARTLALCRIVRAALLLEVGGCTTEQAGLVSGYSSGTAFRNACRRLLNLSPHQLVTAGSAKVIATRLGFPYGHHGALADHTTLVLS